MMLQVKFSPKGGCADFLIQSGINTTVNIIRIQAYVWTSKKINQAVIDLYKNFNGKITIKLLIDKMGSIGHDNLVNNLNDNSNSQIRVDSKEPIAHNKVIIIDDSKVFTGSFNFSQAAESSNAENLLLIQDEPQIIEQYINNFDLHWSHSKEYVKTTLKLVPGYLPNF